MINLHSIFVWSQQTGLIHKGSVFLDFFYMICLGCNVSQTIAVFSVALAAYHPFAALLCDEILGWG